MVTDFPFSALMKRGRGDRVTEITFVRDPSRKFGTPLPDAYKQAVGQLAERLGWQRKDIAEDIHDVSACVGLEEGYGTKIVHKPVEYLAYLLTHGKAMRWRTEPTHLISTRRIVDDQTREEKLFSYDEPVMRIVGAAREEPSGDDNPALSQVLILAGSFNQQRIFADDYRRSKTAAYATTS